MQEDDIAVVFDLEFIGEKDNFEHAAIWEIAAVANDVHFTSLCYPVGVNVPLPPQYSPYFKITRQWLKANAAVAKENTIKLFFDFLEAARVAEKANRIVLTSHGCFKSDQIVLENEARRLGVPMPKNLFFYDTLHLFRQLFKKATSYDLCSLYSSLMGEESVVQAHRAADDVEMLSACLNMVYKEKFKVDGVMVPAGSRSLQSLNGVGTATEALFVAQGICTVEQLVSRLTAAKATKGASLRKLLELWKISAKVEKIVNKMII